MSPAMGLGRGLDTLLSGGPNTATERQENLPINRLQPGKFQPRMQMDDESLEELSASIRVQGIIQPILVRMVEKTPGAEKYEIIAGERRWRAAGLAGLTEVPVIVHDIEDRHALAMSLIENMQRDDLNPIEEALGLQRLIDEFDLTHKEAADAVGRSRSAASNLLRLLQLPSDVRALVMDGSLDMGHARALLPLPQEEQISLGITIADNRLSVRESERLVSEVLNPVEEEVSGSDQNDLDIGEVACEDEPSDNEENEVEPGAAVAAFADTSISVGGDQKVTGKLDLPSIDIAQTPIRSSPPIDQDMLRLQEEIADHLGADVKLRTNLRGGGHLIINFATLDALEGILQALGMHQED